MDMYDIAFAVFRRDMVNAILSYLCLARVVLALGGSLGWAHSYLMVAISGRNSPPPPKKQ